MCLLISNLPAGAVFGHPSQSVNTRSTLIFDLGLHCFLRFLAMWRRAKRFKDSLRNARMDPAGKRPSHKSVPVRTKSCLKNYPLRQNSCLRMDIYIYRDCVPWNGATAAIASLRCPTSILKECMMKRAFLLIRWPDDPQPAKMNTNHCNFSSLEKGQWKPKIPTNSREKRLIKCSKKSVDWAPKPKQVESIQPSVKAYWGQRNTDNRPTEQLDCPGTGSVHTRRPQSRWRAGVSLSGFCQCVVL